MTEEVNNLLTRTEYAKYKGVSKPMVSKWIADGRLVLTADTKLIMVAESDARIKLTSSLNNSFYDQSAKAERDAINKSMQDKGLKELSQEVSYQQLDLETDDAETLFRNARALKEKSAALQAAAEHEQYIGELVERKYVEKILFERARQFRDQLITSARRASPFLSGITNPKEIEDLLIVEYRLMLENFTKLPIVEKG